MNARHTLTVREDARIFGGETRFSEVAAACLYMEPTALCLRGNLEVLMQHLEVLMEFFPFKEGFRSHELLLRADELTVSEKGFCAWLDFRRRAFRDATITFLPSNLSELVRYHPDADVRDRNFDYGDKDAENLLSALNDGPSLVEATFFLVPEGELTFEPCRVEASGFHDMLIAKRRRPLRGDVSLLGDIQSLRPRTLDYDEAIEDPCVPATGL